MKETALPARPNLRALQWLLIPALAIAAYFSVLRIGFLGDDYAYLIGAKTIPLDLAAFLPSDHWFFYRPIGYLFTWALGWNLWGDNAFYYHLVGLLIHAATALTLGMWASEITARRSVGFIAGGLFAVYPLNTEAVGWLAAQWDALATLFALLSLWLFGRWLRGENARYSRLYYLAALLCYGLGLFTKESLLTLLPVFVVAAWTGPAKLGRRGWSRMGLALAPFALLLAANLGLRWAKWGTIGNYPNVNTGYASFFWDRSVAAARVLLSPISTAVLGAPLAQIVGAATSTLLLLGLVWYGRAHSRTVALAGAWLVLTLLAVVNLPFGTGDLQQNRYFYLPSVGYCLLVGTLLGAALADLRRWRFAGKAGLGITLVLSILVCWAQLRPWHTATVQVEAVGGQLLRLIPPEPRTHGMIWYLQNVPDNYEGAYLLRIGMGGLRFNTTGEQPAEVAITDVTTAPLYTTRYDSFALAFAYDQPSNRYNVSYAAGITGEDRLPPSLAPTPGQFTRRWDFRDCPKDIGLDQWRVIEADASCEQGSGLLITPAGGDGGMVGPAIDLASAGHEARFLRIRAAIRYARKTGADQHAVQWYWASEQGSFGEAASMTLPTRENGQTNVYWTFIPASQLGGDKLRLRLDPINDKVAARVEWIVVDTVK